jgi:3,4-dihydroxy 2-butanone 4-phosphate synthase/GTP cyclohydrolase II
MCVIELMVGRGDGGRGRWSFRFLRLRLGMASTWGGVCMDGSATLAERREVPGAETNHEFETGMDAVQRAIDAIAAGRIVLVTDDEDRENEGDLIVAAKFATPETIAFFVRHTSGLICVAVTDERADELQLPLMVARNNESHRTAFTITADYMHGTTTGISATDRSKTAIALADPAAHAEDFAKPGHMHVLRAKPGGVLQRAGHTEAAVDLARLAGLRAAGVLCEVVTEDGLDMARGLELTRLATEHDLPMITIADLIRYRRRQERLVRRAGEAPIPTEWGTFRCIAYEVAVERETHLAFVMGDPRGREDVLVRVHSECVTGDLFGSRRCDCGGQLRAAMGRIAEEGCGVLVYMRGHEGRGIGIARKLEAYTLQDLGLDTVDANVRLGLPVDSREYGVGAQILNELGVTSMRLMTNNPAKRAGLEGFGLTIADRVPIRTMSTDENRRYLETKRDRLGHYFDRPQQ